MIFILLVIFVYANNAYSQKYDVNWVFGDSAGLNFHDGTTNYFGSSIIDGETAASISDSLGNLLFYTNGQNVWNKFNEIMPQGTGLEIGGPGDYFTSSETQGVLIAPKPETNNLFYIFQLQNYDPIGVKYSVVDINLDEGKGDVIEKNIVLFEKDVTEKMQLVKHGNGKDWWLIVHSWPDLIETTDSTLVFVSFLITSEGISGPFEQAYGPKAYLPDVIYNGYGEMIFNKLGNKLAYTRQKRLDIYDFDRCTGLFSNWVEITSIPNYTLYGCSFSSDGSKVYTSTIGDDFSFLYGFSLSDDNIDSSMQIIYQNTFNHYGLGQHEIGPDGKIYISMAYLEFPSDIFTVRNQNLCVINSPNELFPFCDFDTNTISLGDRRVIAGLPNMPNYNLGVLAGSACDTITSAVINAEQLSQFSIFPNPAKNELFIKCDNCKGQFFDISILNAIGEQVLFKKNKQINVPIDISKLKPGMYHLNLYSNNILIFKDKLIIL